MLNQEIIIKKNLLAALVITDTSERSAGSKQHGHFLEQKGASIFLFRRLIEK